ncbi:hypothetical protein K3152_03130 [Qipengyuania sp. 1NDH17]|uniref:DUF4012 domain-containing protein n=1 Tax=Qipengyuania polymorpha TaxID=2867234 RepID=A0ABS7IUX6_9SPHN|nr:hypothetical protein [Qipengyuania polymorpha]MBX7457231.1 hypothetical protein [Qipengyuania polymorpha]
MSGRPARIAGWALRIAVFLVLAGIIAVFQVDRASRDRISLLAWVPPGLGGFADGNIARPLALVKPDMAVERATATLKHRPVDAGNLAAFAVAAIEADDEARAGQALSLAAQRGWRDTYTQVMVIGSALASQRWEVVAQRIDALARLRREEQAINGFLSLTVREDEGRRAIAKRMAESEPLVEAVTGFLDSYSEYGPEVAQTVAYAEEEGALECERLARVARLLLSESRADEVLGFWPQRCDSGGEGMGFAFADNQADPFTWQFPSQAGVSVRPGNEDGTLTARNRDPLRRRFASRYLLLEPGSYTVRLEQSQKSGTAYSSPGRPAEVQVFVRCVRPEEGASAVLLNEPYADGLLFVVPESCKTQHLSLTLGKGRVTDLAIQLSPGGA